MPDLLDLASCKNDPQTENEALNAIWLVHPFLELPIPLNGWQYWLENDLISM